MARSAFSFALVVLLGLPALTGSAALGPAHAQQSGNHGVHVTPVRQEAMANVPGKTMTMVLVDYEPGGGSAAHRHPASGMVFAYVIQGSIRSQVEGQPPKVYQEGESWSEPPGAHHLVSENASDSEPAQLLAVIVADTGANPTVYDP